MVILFVGIGLIFWNGFVFLCYGYDKWQAIRGNWRVSERFLLTITLLCGGIGAFLGGQLFHHKIQKWYFRWSWWLGMVILASMVSIYLFLVSIT
ncbi:DUF1294 domain-containing protein [Streptococcus pluranimalium]|uniref:DUF1294 domain-containing protein n=1 Tax=Streptococcus hyovaginalis TaxID=149015 RepID=UPI0014794862|nr:DUF1294 domain-containing protein [Streptococcus hyovaginalis]MDY3024017.1 DUF1294 domain-containing protein [Streptococcus hyovaginalis]MDY5974758.1 DUF1294 domain-containing protein [Streptococcus hyovaginalis]